MPPKLSPALVTPRCSVSTEPLPKPSPALCTGVFDGVGNASEALTRSPARVPEDVPARYAARACDFRRSRFALTLAARARFARVLASSGAGRAGSPFGSPPGVVVSRPSWASRLPTRLRSSLPAVAAVLDPRAPLGGWPCGHSRQRAPTGLTRSAHAEQPPRREHVPSGSRHPSVVEHAGIARIHVLRGSARASPHKLFIYISIMSIFVSI
jgi:hypothetical protein